MKRKDWINSRTRKEYSYWYQKLHIVDTYLNGGVVANFLNRLNPLTYLFLLIVWLIAPICCLFTTATIQEVFEQTIKGLSGEDF